MSLQQRCEDGDNDFDVAFDRDTHSESLKKAIKRVTTLDGLENCGNIKTTINTAVDSILLVTTTMPICKLSRPPSMKLLRRPSLEGWQQSRQ